jgi:hypothetical protein
LALLGKGSSKTHKKHKTYLTTSIQRRGDISCHFPLVFFLLFLGEGGSKTANMFTDKLSSLAALAFFWPPRNQKPTNHVEVHFFWE